MRTYFLIVAYTLILAGCTNSKKQENGENFSEADGSASKNNDSKSSNFWEKLEMKEIKDGNGTVMALIPVPSSWTVDSKTGISGPHGIKVTDFKLQSFMYNYDERLQRSYDQSGQKMREMPGIERLIQEDFIPYFSNNGMQFVKHYELPEISKLDKWYSDQLFKALPSKTTATAYGTEWKTKDGNPYFLLIHLNVNTSPAMQFWYYLSSGLVAAPAYFEKAKKQYIFSLSNMRYNLEPIIAYNKQEAQRVGQSWAAFNERMAKNQAAFEASQRAFVNKSEAINDAIMSGWKQRNAASDKNQEQFVDNIYERTNVQNTATGQTYKVQEGANQYWMNNNGEYIGTTLQGYDPNQDELMNEQKWEELKRIKQ